jgi:2-polyprenyl-3-methyl-5-hydroxy-6-metoxy-1,4-benzoquinol methylase
MNSQTPYPTLSAESDPIAGSPIVNRPWPKEDLEEVPACPLCADVRRKPLHLGIQDLVFFSSAEGWNLWTCENCQCSYLSPRPTIESINRAYLSYYTHTTDVSPDKHGWARRMYRSLRAVYEIGQLGDAGSVSFAQRLAAACAGLVFGSRWDTAARLYPPRKGARLLDVGCGNGDYLQLANRIGWNAEGIDPDPKAVDAAQDKGLNVRCADLESEVSHSAGSFDAVTLSHVIEHFHDPIDALRKCYALLRPGGRIWVVTPRLNSQGHCRFGTSWRGLEPPRHLILYTEHSLRKALKSAGFESPTFKQVGPTTAFYWEQSNAMLNGHDPYILQVPLPLPLRLSAWIEDLQSMFSAHAGEQVCVIAEKKTIANASTQDVTGEAQQTSVTYHPQNSVQRPSAPREANVL